MTLTSGTSETATASRAGARARGEARRTTTTALLAALLAASTLLTIPVQPVPLTMQVLIVVLIALVVAPGWAALSVLTYLLLGAAGLPVFAGMRGGMAVLVGPTGGYLLGFLAGAVAGSWLRERLERVGVGQLRADGAAALVVIASVYGLGWLQLTLATGMGPGAALLAGVVPFIVPDVLKAAAAMWIAGGVRRAIGS